LKDKHFALQPKVATIVAQIASYENELSQGSPCSPVISNLVGHLLDARLVDKVSGAGGEAIFLHQDVTLEETWSGIIEATERRFGRLNVMVANAGIGILCKAVDMSLADWRRQTAVNLDGVFLSVKYAIPAMRRAGGGSIIITSSTAGEIHYPRPTLS
jgi:NAD(P)-dependent dehydrogenase (short-subunit alcohol dehydrogenase family)